MCWYIYVLLKVSKKNLPSRMTRPTVLTKTLKMSMARLSSARHINSASADAAGIVIASRLKSEIREKDQAFDG